MTGSGERVVAHRAWEWIIAWVGGPVLGAGVGWAVKPLAAWVAALPWAPLQGPFKLAESVPDWVLIGVGALAGLALAFLVAMDMLRVTVSAERVVLERGDDTTSIDGADVGTVFLDGKKLVLLGADGQELASENTDLDAKALREAFTATGYTWLADGDPHSGDYRLWVEDTPGLPTGADALLKARKRAISRSDDEDVRLLRTELVKLGVVVRDDKKRQYWRLTAKR
ncbi:YqeB family protein [Allokutzneria oryzae]|uniref:DUF308 domain-containing protein n=1 Tax=Allokutzneria oryzae TaxID=1378989 RepID=A0ABV6AAJ9_9PSEU